MTRRLLVGLALLAVVTAVIGASSPAALRYIAGQSIFKIGHSIIIGVNGMEINKNGRDVLIDADWNDAQLILRNAAPANPRRSDMSVTLFDARGNRVPTVMHGCVSSSSVPIVMSAPRSAPVPQGFVPLVFSRTPAPRHSQVVVRCARIRTR